MVRRRLEIRAYDLLENIISHGVAVEVGGAGDIDAALRYGNHSSITPYQVNNIATIADDNVRLGRVFVFRGKRQAGSPVCACRLWVSRFRPGRSELSMT